MSESRFSPRRCGSELAGCQDARIRIDRRWSESYCIKAADLMLSACVISQSMPCLCPSQIERGRKRAGKKKKKHVQHEIKIKESDATIPNRYCGEYVWANVGERRKELHNKGNRQRKEKGWV